jgi:hypothetical protein
MTTTYKKVQLRRGSAQEWSRYNTVLDVGEIGFETDTYKFKIGQYSPGTSDLIAWNNLDYFNSNKLSGDDIEFDGTVSITDDTCFTGNIMPCADGTFTLGEAARRWKNVHASDAIQLGNLVVTSGPASEATGGSTEFLKINGDDIATRTELEKKNSSNLRLAAVDDASTSQYLFDLFQVLERQLPPMIGISTQSQFNGWVVEALEHVDEIAHQGGNIDPDGNLIIGDIDIDLIIGSPTNNCQDKLDIYNHTTVHCMMEAKKGIKVLDSDETNFVKANGTVSTELPLEQSRWVGVPRL